MAASNVGDVLFQRGQEDDSEDIWDDTALIKAYDEAISLMKMKVAEQSGLSVTDEDVLAGQSSVKKKRKKARAKKGRKWKVGDQCRARFSEDQCFYEAEILSIDSSAGTCFVRYSDYGNEEEVNIKDLQRSRKPVTPLESGNETDSGVDGRSGRSSQRASHTASHPYMMPPPWGGPAVSSSFPGSMFGGMPPPPPPPHFSTQGFPTMAPPPPPPTFEDMSAENSEALCSMLMSWYMSGYHTGYYQGLQQGKKLSGASFPYVKR